MACKGGWKICISWMFHAHKFPNFKNIFLIFISSLTFSSSSFYFILFSIKKTKRSEEEEFFVWVRAKKNSHRRRRRSCSSKWINIWRLNAWWQLPGKHYPKTEKSERAFFTFICLLLHAHTTARCCCCCLETC